MSYLAPTATLHRNLLVAGIPITGVSGGPPWTVQYDPSATQGQIDQGNSMAAAFDGKGRQTRTLAAIYSDMQKLTTTQHNKAWADISAPAPGAPTKYLTDVGINAGPIFVLHWTIYNSGASGAQLLAAQKEMLTMYVQDNPTYLMQPTFDPTINISGDDPWVPPTFSM